MESNDLTGELNSLIIELSKQGNSMSIAQWSESDKTKFIEWLRSHLVMGEMFVNFEKKDGTLREMRCTLKDVPEYERKTEGEAPRKKNEGVMSVFDLDKQEWRSFRIDSVRSVRFDL
jgi:hypothetical protein